MGKSKKSSVRLPSDDAMTDDLREAIRAKHRLVEQMKEDVKDGDRDGKGDGSGEPKRSPVTLANCPRVCGLLAPAFSARMIQSIQQIGPSWRQVLLLPGSPRGQSAS